MLSPETKNKIAQCLALSMEIEGANFDFHPQSGCLSVFKLNPDAEYFFNYSYYDTDQPDTLDNLIKDLSNHITTENLKDETPSH